MNKNISLDSSYSTTRLLTKRMPFINSQNQQNSSEAFETIHFLANNENKQDIGGLRTQGYFKSSYNSKPLITVITVVFNGEKYLEETIKSVILQTYDNVEYIIIDGGSTDRTVDSLQKYKKQIDYWVSEKDYGIYNAMNKGIRLASGKWICMMNAGDTFHNRDVLLNTFQLTIDADLIYSDTWMKEKGRFWCDINANRIVHQSLIYKKQLHDEVGLYLESPKITIADYIFFQLCKDKKWYKTSFIISTFDPIGVSANIEHFKQKIAVDIMFGTIPRLRGSIILLLHPLYHRIKRIFRGK